MERIVQATQALAKQGHLLVAAFVEEDQSVIYSKALVRQVVAYLDHLTLVSGEPLAAGQQQACTHIPTCGHRMRPRRMAPKR
jgi:hypothetical protein